MPRLSKAQMAAKKAALEERLALPVLPEIPSDGATEDQAASGGEDTPAPAAGVTPEQRLKDIQAQRVALMQKVYQYKQTHQLEFFTPHEKQLAFIKQVLNPERRFLCALGGNRSGKTSVVAALAASLALGRLGFCPKPKPFTFPPAQAVRFLDGNQSVEMVFSEGTVAAATKAWNETYLSGEAPEFPGIWRDNTLDTRAGIFPANGSPKQPGTFEYLRARLQNPPDPGKLRFNPPVKIRMFGEKTDTLSEVQVPKLKQYLPADQIALTKKGQTGVIEHFLLKNGSTIDLLTYQQDPASMEGWDGHVCIFDEPPPRPVYTANVRGLVDHKGIALFSMTPLKEPWISDLIVNNPAPEYFSMMMSSYDNPHIDKSALDSFFAGLDEEEIQTRRDGKFLHLQGLVFKEFKKEVHVVKPFTPDRAYTVYAAIDNHPRTEQAVLFVAVDRHDRVFAFKEIFQHGTPEEIVAWITEFHDHTHPIEMVLIDRSSQGDTNRGLSTYEVIEEGLNRAGIPLDFGSKDLQGGIQIVRDYLLSRNGVPSLFIAEDCTRLIWELLRYRWAEWRAGADKSTRTPLNKPVDADDHLVENLRRLLQLPPAWVDPRHRVLLQGGERRWEPSDPLAGY